MARSSQISRGRSSTRARATSSSTTTAERSKVRFVSEQRGMIDRVEPLQVVATAGHVDHGKSSLITRLTGIDPDRLAEEKRRGLTIDLGFAWATLPSGREVGFVDVPGHERFVRTMLAGVGPVRLVLFVVAADEGWRRQTEEHLAIVDVLGVTGLFVDRVFPVAGAGTVVTGTLTGGPLAVGDEAEVLPTGVRARIRSLQTHKRQIEVARPVSRVAVNLAGVDRSRLSRGDVLAHPERWHPTSLIEAKVRPVRGLAHELTSRGAFSFHAGAADRDAKLHLYAERTVPDDGAFVRIYLSAPVVLDVSDRFVLRESGRSETVAGGVVLDAFPPRRAGATAVDRLTVRERATRDELAELLVSERGAVKVADVWIVAGTDPSDIANTRRARDWWVHDRVADVVRDDVTATLQAFHDASPNVEGRETAGVRRDIDAALRRAGAPSDAEVADALLARLVGRNAGIATEEVERVARAVADAEPTPPTVAELQRRGFSGVAIDAAVRRGVLVRIAPDLVLTRSMVDRAIEVVREAGAEGSTVSSVRERLGTSRRYAVPLMEHLDRTGATRRSGDLRFARGT